MIPVTAEVLGTAETKAAFLSADGEVRARLRRTLADLGALLRDRARALAPKGKTHRLDDSIQARQKESSSVLTETVGRPIFYGRFQELGINTMREPRRTRGIVGVRTRTTRTGAVLVSPRRGLLPNQGGAPKRFVLRARPFMQPSLDALRDRIQADLQKAVGG